MIDTTFRRTRSYGALLACLLRVTVLRSDTQTSTRQAYEVVLERAAEASTIPTCNSPRTKKKKHEKKKLCAGGPTCRPPLSPSSGNLPPGFVCTRYTAHYTAQVASVQKGASPLHMHERGRHAQYRYARANDDHVWVPTTISIVTLASLSPMQPKNPPRKPLTRLNRFSRPFFPPLSHSAPTPTL